MRRAILVAVLVAGTARAQTVEPAPPPVAALEAKVEPPPPVAGWKDGFFIASPDGKNLLRIGGYLHFDGRFFVDDEADRGVDQFTFRRIRPSIEGVLLGAYEFRLLTDFAGGRVVVQDAYVDIHHRDELRLRLGKLKAPFGLERLQSATAIVFVERAFPTSLAPNRDLGIQLHGELLGKTVAYQAGVFDGVADGGSSDGDVADGKELAARLFVTPFARSKNGWLSGLAVGGAVTWGDKLGSLAATDLPTLRTSSQAAFFSYLTAATLDGTAIADGKQTRLTAQGHYYGGPIGLLFEFVRSRQGVRLGSSSAELTSTAWQVAGDVVIGGKATFKGATVSAPLDPAAGHWGALELAARVSGIDLDDDAFPTFADPSKSATAATAVAGGASWHLSRQLKLVLDLERTSFDGGGAGGADRPAETVVLGRAQTVF